MESKPDLVNFSNLVASMEVGILKYYLEEIVYNSMHNKGTSSKPKKIKKNKKEETISEIPDSSGSSSEERRKEKKKKERGKRQVFSSIPTFEYHTLPILIERNLPGYEEITLVYLHREQNIMKEDVRKLKKKLHKLKPTTHKLQNKKKRKNTECLL